MGICVFCQANFKSNNARKKYCNNKCRQDSYVERNRSKIVARNAKWREENRERYREVVLQSYHRNKDNYSQSMQQYRENNREKYRILNKRYRKTENGRKLHNATEGKRRAQKLSATPKWADMDKIKQIYKNCPEGHHVDHIVPLQGKNVCGLHIESNLQYLPAEENIKKGNKVE